MRGRLGFETARLFFVFLAIGFLVSITTSAQNLSELNFSEPNQSELDIAEPESFVEISITGPDQIDRLDQALLIGTVSGYAQNVQASWSLPAGLELINGSIESNCGKLSGESCVFEIYVRVLSNAPLGPEDLELEVEYV
ncbi:MAG: hypothetical protein GOU99_01925 [Candidatus Altiarchaeota archaeon]|nr:hypothetical protein [Candidatus Altiarchaeota archaeon]